MKKRKYILFKLLLVIVLFLLLSSCNNNDNKKNDNQTNSLKEPPTEISLGYWEIQFAFKENDAVLQKIENDLNIDIRPINVSWNDYIEKYKIYAASNQLPDVFADNILNTQTYIDWIEQDIVRALPDDLRDYPNLEKIMELPDIQNIKYNGKFYTIPRISFYDRKMYASSAAMLVRKDWMGNMGIEDPKDWTEFKEMLKAFVENDPDGNNKNDTTGLAINTRDALGKWLILTMYPDLNFVYNSPWIKEDDKYIPVVASENYIKVLKKIKNLYNDNLLDQDFAIQKSGDGTTKFVQGKAGALEYHSTPSALNTLSQQWYKYNPDVDFTDAVKLLHVFPAEDGELYHNAGTIYWSETYFSAEVDDKKMGKILQLFDYLISEKGEKLILYGIENEDYKIENEKTMLLRQKDENGRMNELVDKYPSLSVFIGLATWGGYREFERNEINIVNYGEDIFNMALAELEWNFENAKPLERPYEVLAYTIEEKIKFDSINFIDDITKTILTDEDIEVYWNEILEDYKNRGMNEAIEAVNEKALEN